MPLLFTMSLLGSIGTFFYIILYPFAKKTFINTVEKILSNLQYFGVYSASSLLQYTLWRLAGFYMEISCTLYHK